MNASNKPLTGIKVIEMTHMVMGPAVGAILGDLGAEVIKIEPISGDKTRVLKKSGSGYFLTYNRNKRSLAMDIKKEEGKKIIRSLIRKSDVFIENFRPGAMDNLGFSYEEFSKLNPEKVYQNIQFFFG